MPVGTPGVEQFRDAIIEFRNQHIIAAMSPMMTMRGQVVASDAFKVQGGFTDTTRNYFLQLLQDCDKWRRVITYNPDRTPLGDVIKKAITTANVKSTDVLLGQSGSTPLVEDPQPFGGDEVQGASGLLKQVPWALDNTDPNIPTNSLLNFRSQEGMLLLQAIDASIVAWTRLESRNRTRFVTVFDSMRMYGMYVQILEYLTVFGGDGNMVDIANGVKPTEEPRGAANSPNMLTEAAGKSGIVGQAAAGIVK